MTIVFLIYRLHPLSLEHRDNRGQNKGRGPYSFGEWPSPQEERIVNAVDTGALVNTCTCDSLWRGPPRIQNGMYPWIWNIPLLTNMILIKISGKVFGSTYLVLFSHNHFPIRFLHNQIISHLTSIHPLRFQVGKFHGAIFLPPT